MADCEEDDSCGDLVDGDAEEELDEALEELEDAIEEAT